MVSVYLKIIKTFCEWKNAKIAEIKKNDSFSIKCDKKMSSLMSIDYSDESTLTKMRGMIYQKMKIDITTLMDSTTA
jgi:hypothetical protein